MTDAFAAATINPLPKKVTWRSILRCGHQMPITLSACQFNACVKRRISMYPNLTTLRQSINGIWPAMYHMAQYNPWDYQLHSEPSPQAAKNSRNSSKPRLVKSWGHKCNISCFAPSQTFHLQQTKCRNSVNKTPQRSHLTAVKRIIGYLKSTPEYGFSFEK